MSGKIVLALVFLIGSSAMAQGGHHEIQTSDSQAAVSAWMAKGQRQHIQDLTVLVKKSKTVAKFLKDESASLGKVQNVVTLYAWGEGSDSWHKEIISFDVTTDNYQIQAVSVLIKTHLAGEEDERIVEAELALVNDESQMKFESVLK